MATFTDKFFEDKAVGALWDVAVSIKRGNPLPLDKDAVVHGIDELNAVASGAVSYPGQIIAVVIDAVKDDEGKEVSAERIDLYYLDHNKNPQPIGAADGKSLAFNSDNKLEIKGFKQADSLTLPQKQADGSIKWVAISEIVKGDGNTVTTLDEAENESALTVTLNTDSEAKKEYTIALNISAEPGNKLSKNADGLYVADYDDSALTEEINKKANSADVYTKTKADELLGAKANAADVYSKTDADALLLNKADKNSVYTKEEANNLFGGAFHFRGEKASLEELNTLETKAIGDVYQVSDKEYAWDGSKWVELGFNIDLSEYAKKGESYTKGETDNLLDAKANAADVYTDDEVDALLLAKADASAVYTKTEADNLLKDKANAADVYTKEEANELLSAKATVATVNGIDERLGTAEEEIDAIQEALPDKLEASDLEPYALKTELDPLATKKELEPLATTEALNKAVEDLNKNINAKLDLQTWNDMLPSLATDEEVSAKIGIAPVKNEETGEYEGATGIYTDIYTKAEITKLVADITGGESAADVLAALNEYKTTTDPRVKTLEDTVNGIPATEGSEKVPGLVDKVADHEGRIVALENKEDYVLPVATETALGGVKSSPRTVNEETGAVTTAVNSVNVAADGKMTVNSLDVERLVQTGVLVLYGGSASDNI